VPAKTNPGLSVIEAKDWLRLDLGIELPRRSERYLKTLTTQERRGSCE